jgi:hypothetical protein
VPKRTTLFTSQPDQPAPPLRCPTCDSPLIYRQTILGVMMPRERWDYYDCRQCGPFQLRDRTGVVRSVAGPATPILIR